MIHNHSSGKHRLWRKVLSVCIAFAMICSVSISAFAVEASSETANENIETVQSGSAEEAEELTATEAENDQSVDELQPEEPAVTTGDENTEEPTDVIEAPSEDPEQPEEPSVEPGEEPIQPADPTVTEQPEEPTVTEQPEEPGATPAGDADASVDEVQDVELEAQADAQSVQDIEQEQDPVAVQERWGSYQNYTGIAAIYYLATPDGIPESNDTQYWAPESDKSKLFGKINTNGAVWEKVDNKDKNIRDYVNNHVSTWPDGTAGSSWIVKRSNSSGNVDGKTYFNYILDSIWNAYKDNLRNKLGITDLKQEDVTEITLKPFKISRDNSTTTKQNYHIDCTIDIVCKKPFTAKFWIKSPEASKYDLYDAKDYIRGRKVETTEKATIGSKEVINGITYVLDGWYPENAGGGACGDQKITTWPYLPKNTELADGTVNFYAHYIPLYTTVNIKKIVTGNMGDKSKAFHFKVFVVNGNISLPFNIDETQCSGSAEITLSDNQTTNADKGSSWSNGDNYRG
ncbi:MAG: hypothetical protein ACLRIP_03080 [Blautia massiliensis (ex Durand et al. 2017)]